MSEAEKSTPLYKLCDNILGELNKSKQKPIYELIASHKNRQAVFEQLKDDKYIRYENGGQDYAITPKGEAFIENGGYGKFYERERKREEYIDQLQASTIATNNSVKETNNSIKHVNEVLTPDNFRLQEKIAKTSFRLGLVSAFFIAASTCKQYVDKSEEKLEGVKIELNHLNKKIEDYQRALKKDTTDTPPFPQKGRN